MAKDIAKESESSLSPAPEDLAVPAESKQSVKIAPNGRKRKAEATATTTVETTKRNKKFPAAEANKDNDSVKAESSETPRKKRTTASKINYNDSADEATGETTAAVTKTVKQKVVRTKKSKEPAQPLEARTIDTKLRIGAHVSVAGG